MSRSRAVLFDVDGTLIDALANQRQVWHAWAELYGLDPMEVYATALRTRPLDTFTAVVPAEDPDQCLAQLHALEDEDVRSGTYSAFAGAADLLTALPQQHWALVTSNYAHRVAIRFQRCGLPLPEVVIDAPATAHGKPHPAPYLLAAQRLGAEPGHCLAIEDTASGATAGLAAGMTVWSVNANEPVPGAHRHYASLQAAAADILNHLN